MFFNGNLELNVSGFEECRPSKGFGPAVRDYYLFHYILSGTGIFTADNKTYVIKAGQMFVIFPGDVTFYRAGEKDPWTYAWVGFSGDAADKIMESIGIAKNDPVKDVSDESAIRRILLELASLSSFDLSESLRGASLMYAFLCELSALSPCPVRTGDRTSKNIYVKAVENHIRNNYQNDITVSSIASMVGLNRSYLSTLFRQINKKSIQGYLIDYRLRRALRLLRDTDLTVLEAARSVGYSDQSVFSKAFKKHFGMSPREIRKSRVIKC